MREPRKDEIARLTLLAKQHKNRITPKLVVADARSKNSPLHERIWGKSDKVLADQQRLEIAHELIQTWRVVVQTETGVKHKDRVLTYDGNGRVYRPVADLGSSHELREDAWRQTRSSVLQVAIRCDELSRSMTGLDGKRMSQLADELRAVANKYTSAAAPSRSVAA